MSMIYKAQNMFKLSAAFAVVFAVLYWIQVPSASIVTTMRPLGRVLEVRNCNSGKNSLNCTVQTTTHRWQTDVTDWPGDNVQVGDELGYRFDETRTRKEQWVCRNGMCRAQSICWSWMPCWENKT